MMNFGVLSNLPTGSRISNGYKLLSKTGETLQSLPRLGDFFCPAIFTKPE